MVMLKGQILEKSDVYADSWRAFDGQVTEDDQHHRVHHHRVSFSGAIIMLMALKTSGASQNLE
jgi:transposase-like protein